MKKTLVFAVVAMLLVAMILPCTVSAAEIATPTTGKTNVLTEELGMLESPSNSMVFETKLTDGIVASPIDGSTEYFNKAWTSSKAQGEASKAPSYTFKMKDGTEKSYVYTITFSELNCDVDSFSLFFANHTKYEDGTNGFWQLDSQWAMLVSTDNGETWSEAFRTADPVVKPYDFGEKKGFVVENGGAKLIEEGGIFSEVKGTVKDGETDKEYWYRYTTQNFDRKYENVTDIAYACICPRMNFTRIDETKPDQEIGMIDANTGLPTDDPYLGSFYYIARISEIEVYGTKREAAATTEEITEAPVVTTEEPKTDAPVASTEEPKTDAPVNTDAPATDAPKTDDKKGCGSSAAIAGVAIVMTLGCAVIRKKH